MARRGDPARRSARATRGDELRGEIRRVWDEHFQGDVPRKVWRLSDVTESAQRRTVRA